MRLERGQIINEDINTNAAINIGKTTLSANNNITLDETTGELNVPDTLIADNAIQNKHISYGVIDISKTTLRAGRLMEMIGNKLHSDLQFGVGLELEGNTIKTVPVKNFIRNNEIASDANITISKTNLAANKNITLTEQGILNVPDTLIADGAIESKHYGNNTILKEHIANNSIENRHIVGPIDMDKLTLQAGDNIDLSNNVLNVPDTLIGFEAINNSHIPNKGIDLKKIDLKFGTNIFLTKNTLNVPETVIADKGLLTRHLSDTLEIANKHISDKPADKISINKTTLDVNKNQLEYEQGIISIKDIYVKKDEDDNVTIGNDLTVDGNLIVKGDTFEVQTTTIQMEDHNIELGKIAMPTDDTAVDGGIILKGTKDKKLTWKKGINGGNWTSNVNFNLELGNFYKINDNVVMSANSLGDVIKRSKLETVGTITQGIWEGSKIDISFTKLEAGNNIELSGNELNVPDTLVANNAIQNKHIAYGTIDISKTTLKAGNNISLNENILNIPDTVVAEKGIQSSHIGDKVITNRHIENNTIDISKTTLRAGRLMKMIGNKLHSDLQFGEGLHVHNNIVTGVPIIGSISNKDISDNANIDITKTNIKAGKGLYFVDNIIHSEVVDGSIMDIDISENANISMSKIDFRPSDQFIYNNNTGNLEINDIYLKNDNTNKVLKGDLRVDGNFDISGGRFILRGDGMRLEYLSNRIEYFRESDSIRLENDPASYIGFFT